MKKKVLVVYFLTLVGIGICLGLIVLAPYLKNQSNDWNICIYAIFSPLCHQMPSRSFSLFSYPLAVCARCFGVYIGFFMGTCVYPIFKGFSPSKLPRLRAFFILSFPIVIDTLGNLFHLWTSSNICRFATGFLWGIILPFYFIIGLIDYFVSRAREYSCENIS